jgi:hypothetical protein
MFDIDSYLKDPSSNGTWYAQRTTGDVPPPRIDFCTVAISAPDNSSHHIYLYGGINPITNTGFDDVVILTIPSFTWTNVWNIGDAPRWGHNCHIAGKRQMITVGGNNTNGLICDWELKGVAVWGLTTLTWGSVFLNNLTSFEVPQPVLELTGGSPKGGATKQDPALGWTDQGLKDVFATARQFPSPTTSPHSKKNTAAIAGGVVGGIAGVVLLAGIAFFLSRRNCKTVIPQKLYDDPPPKERDNSEVSRHTAVKHYHEMQAVNEASPVELFNEELRELDSANQAVEVDPKSSTTRVELSGTTTAPGGVHGVPIVRTPGDDLPEQPVYVPGLRRPSG